MLKSIQVTQNVNSVEIRHNDQVCIIPPKYMESFWHILNANIDSLNTDELLAYNHMQRDHIHFISECLSDVLGPRFNGKVKFVESPRQYNVSPLSFDVYKEEICRLRKTHGAKTLDDHYIDTEKDQRRDKNSTHIGLFCDAELIGCCRTTDCHTGISYLEEIDLLSHCNLRPYNAVEISRLALSDQHKRQAMNLVNQIRSWFTRFTEYDIGYAICAPNLTRLYTRTGAEIVKRFSIRRKRLTEFVLVQYTYSRKRSTFQQR